MTIKLVGDGPHKSNFSSLPPQFKIKAVLQDWSNAADAALKAGHFSPLFVKTNEASMATYKIAHDTAYDAIPPLPDFASIDAADRNLLKRMLKEQATIDRFLTTAENMLKMARGHGVKIPETVTLDRMSDLITSRCAQFGLS